MKTKSGVDSSLQQTYHFLCDTTNRQTRILTGELFYSNIPFLNIANSMTSKCFHHQKWPTWSTNLKGLVFIETCPFARYNSFYATIDNSQVKQRIFLCGYGWDGNSFIELIGINENSPQLQSLEQITLQKQQSKILFRALGLSEKGSIDTDDVGDIAIEFNSDWRRVDATKYTHTRLFRADIFHQTK